METETARETKTRDRDRSATSMDWTVGLATVAMSWTAWTGLAEMCGHTQTLDLGLFTFHLSWLTALMVDMYALRAFRSWLRSGSWVSTETRRFAKWSTIAAIVVGVLGNIAYYVMEASGTKTAPLWVTIPVSSLAPLALGALGHLRALERRDRQVRDSRTVETPVSRKTVVPKIQTPVSVSAPKSPVSAVSQAPKVEAPLPVVPVPTPREATVSSLTAKSQSRADQLQAIKEHATDWLTRGGEVSYAEITAATKITGKESLKKLRAALVAEAATLQASAPQAEDPTPTEDRELVSVG